VYSPIPPNETDQANQPIEGLWHVAADAGRGDTSGDDALYMSSDSLANSDGGNRIPSTETADRQRQILGETYFRNLLPGCVETLAIVIAPLLPNWL
jgi:hypothetical protein